MHNLIKRHGYMNKIKERKTAKILDLKELSFLNNFILINNPASEYIMKQPFIFDEITFALCTKGQSLLKINLENHTITENYILIVPPNQIIEMVSKSCDFEMKPLFFSSDFIAGFKNYERYEISEKIRKTPCLKVSREDMSLLVQFHSLILHLYTSNDNISIVENMIKGILSALLEKVTSLYISTEIDHSKTSPKDDFIRTFTILVGKYHKQERSVSFYAEKMNVTSKSLSININRITGRNALVWINDFVITKIKILLKTSNLTATQISEEYNFSTPSLFGRFFKKYTGMTPNKFRHT